VVSVQLGCFDEQGPVRPVRQSSSAGTANNSISLCEACVCTDCIWLLDTLFTLGHPHIHIILFIYIYLNWLHTIILGHVMVLSGCKSWKKFWQQGSGRAVDHHVVTRVIWGLITRLFLAWTSMCCICKRLSIDYRSISPCFSHVFVAMLKILSAGAPCGAMWSHCNQWLSPRWINMAILEKWTGKSSPNG